MRASPNVLFIYFDLNPFSYDFLDQTGAENGWADFHRVEKRQPTVLFAAESQHRQGLCIYTVSPAFDVS
jgi:hypothetical protein